MVRQTSGRGNQEDQEKQADEDWEVILGEIQYYQGLIARGSSPLTFRISVRLASSNVRCASSGRRPTKSKPIGLGQKGTMKTTISKLFFTFILAGLAATQARAAIEPVTFDSQELSIDAFGFYGSLDKGGGDNSAWGYGVGINYFITQNIGVGIDTWADAFEAPYLLDFNATFRYPLTEYNLENLAPYGIAGLGRQWEHAPTWFFDFGAGAEFRLQQNFGVFADLRGVFPVDRDPYALLRFGVRFRLR
jgi:hypothetical protein